MHHFWVYSLLRFLVPSSHRQRKKEVMAAASLGRGGFAAAKEPGWYIGHRKRSRFT